MDAQIIRQFIPDVATIGVPAAVGNGNINDTYRLDFSLDGRDQTIIIQRLNHQVFKQPEMVMENTLKVCQYLLAQDYPLEVPLPLPAKSGAFLMKDAQGNFWRAFPYIGHSYTPEGLATPEIAREAAKAYGAFARALRHFPAETLAETIPGFHNTDQRWAVFLEVLGKDPVGRVKGVQEEIEALFAAKPLFDLISGLKQSGALPLRVVHNDTKAGNVLFDEKTHLARAVIDLDTVMPGTILSDFGDMVRTFVPTISEDGREQPGLSREILDALKEGFLSQTGDFIADTEREHLLTGGAWIIGEQALRFLTDWIAGDVYYKIAYPEHNLVRARNQLLVLHAVQAIL
ncbi:MAG: aminoglycoside phosphotransferase family protein [Chitinophagales bacterium]|nr:aminoglycoside phosphotransferase family protein [Chitinophagales bacterium]